MCDIETDSGIWYPKRYENIFDIEVVFCIWWHSLDSVYFIEEANYFVMWFSEVVFI